MREAIPQKPTELWKNQSWILYHDNATHISMLKRKFLAKNKTEETNERKAFCCDCDKGKIETETVGDTKNCVSELFRGLEKRWHKCIISEGGYFEGQIMIDE